MTILNHEWPRSETIRKRSLESSNPGFPMNLILVETFGSTNKVLGHARISKIPANQDAVFIESVIIHPHLRGKGIGKYLMLKTEEFVKSLHSVKSTSLETQIYLFGIARGSHVWCNSLKLNTRMILVRQTI